MPWVLGVTVLCTGASASGEAPEGPRVRAVRFESTAPVDKASFRRHLPLGEGEPLGEAKLAESVEWLREKEIFSEVSVNVDRVGDEAIVTFLLVPADFVVGVEVRGARGVSEDEILRRTRIREDEPLSEAKEDAAVERVRALYADRGYPAAEIRVVRRVVRPGQIEVVLNIEEGPPLRLASLTLSGVSDDLLEAARGAVGVREEDVFHPGLPVEARNRIVRFFRARGFYEVEVRERSEQAKSEMAVVLEVWPGPRFEIILNGNRVFGRSELLALADLERRPIVTDGTWRLLARRMQQEYRGHGYAFAEVGISIEEEDPKRVIFDIEEGPRVRVAEVRFEGAHGLSEERLRNETRSGRSSILPWGGEEPWLREDLVSEDRERLLEQYRSNGFPDAQLREIRREFSDDRRRVVLVFVVEEGRRNVVREVVVIDPEGLLENPKRSLVVEPGRPLVPARIEEDQRTLTGLAAREGFPEAVVEVDIERLSEEKHTRDVALRYRLSPGTRVRIGRIVIQRNYFTRDRVIRRELPFRSGDPFDPGALLEAQRRIYRLGLFRSVSVQPLGTRGVVRDVLVRVVERPGGELQYGFGYNSRAGLRNFVQIGHRNVLGTGRPVTLRGELNLSPENLVPDEYLIGFDTREPRVFDSGFDLLSNLVLQRSEREIDEFSIRRFSFATGFEREFLPRFQMNTTIEFEDSRVFDVAPDAVLTGQDEGRLRTVSLNPIFVYDGRDDAFAPTRGVFDTFRLRYGSPALGSEVHFVKVNAQHSHHVPLTEGWSIVYAARGGIAEPIGVSRTIPLRERFFLGGRNSVRGFEENSIGPRGEQGNPVGGDLVFSGNLELRFPLLWELRGAIFLDGGGLFLRERNVRLNDVRESAGLGLRYQTPVGAINLDYGFKLDRRRRESIGEVHFTIGSVF